MAFLLKDILGDHLEQWAGTAVAPTILPALVRRLLLATAPLDHLSMPADGGAWRGGFDGVVIARSGGPFWPSRASIWELSVSEKVKRKLDDDFRKRTDKLSPEDRRQTTYVGVTSRRFPEKAEWASEKAATGAWAGVRVLDVDDLATWLTLAPAVSSWFASEHLGIPATDISDVDTFLATWSQRTRPSLPARLALSRRSEVTASFLEWLQGSPAPIRISADTREEVVVFAAACVALDTSPSGEARKLRAVVVHTEAALRWVLAQGSAFDGLILPTFEPAKVTTGLAKARIVVALDPEAVSAQDAIKLGPVKREDIFRALVDGGMEEEKARRLATESRGRLHAIQRQLGYGYVEPPPWARSEDIRDLVVLLLVGAYVHGSSADRDAFEALGCPPARIEQMCSRLLHAEGAPLTRKGGAVVWASHQDAWSVLAREFTNSVVESFLAVAQQVLGQDDPGLELSGDDRFLAALHGKVLSHSEALRSGIAISLARLAHTGDAGPYANAVGRVVGAILVASWRRWATLSDLLVPLAEAAPTVFLDRLDEALAAGEDGVAHLFKEETSFRNVHAGLLWALDRIAWSEAHLTRVVLVLAKLAERDPGGTWANRPARTLHEILHERMPQSFARVAQRISLMKVVANRHPTVAWSLCMAVLAPAGMMLPHARPDFMRVQPVEPDVTAETLAAQRRAGVEILTDLAGRSGSKWGELVDGIARLDDEERTLLLGRLEAADIDDPTLVWDHLRKATSLAASLLKANEHGADSRKELLQRLERLLPRLAPQDPIARIAYLFDGLPDLADDSAFDYKTRLARATAARKVALESVLGAPDPWPAIARLAMAAPQPYVLAVALAESARADETEGFLLGRNDEVSSRLIPSFLARLGHDRGLEWFLTKLHGLAAAGRVADAASAATCWWGPSLALWEGLDVHPAVAAAYWQKKGALGNLGADEWSFAIPRLVAAGRAFEAVVFADTGEAAVATATSLKALEGLAEAIHRQEDVKAARTLGAFEWHLRRLLDRVAADESLPSEKVAAVELVMALAFRLEGLPPRLSQEMERSPAMFVHLVCLLYRGDDDPKPESPGQASQNAASNAARLLHDWNGYAGRSLPQEERETALEAWAEEALKALAEAKRSGVGAIEVARVLARPPSAADGMWPCIAARKLLATRGAGLARALAIAKFNLIGVRTRALGVGGHGEREIAARYEEWARELDLAWPETASMLREMARQHEQAAKQEDREAAEERDEVDMESEPSVASKRLPQVDRALRETLSGLPDAVVRLAYIKDVDPGGDQTLVVYALLAHEGADVPKVDVERRLREALEPVAQAAVHVRWRTLAEHDVLDTNDARRAVDVSR
jgi:hypothetical protein